MTKPIVVEVLQTWYEHPDFLKLPESPRPENNDNPKPDSVLFEKSKHKVKNYRKTKKVLAIQADTTEEQDFDSRKLLETIALCKVLLRRRTFVFSDNISLNVLEKVRLAKEATIRLCQDESNRRKSDNSITDLTFTSTIVVLFEVADVWTNPICLIR